jgi:hypothetical protein
MLETYHFNARRLECRYAAAIPFRARRTCPDHQNAIAAKLPLVGRSMKIPSRRHQLATSLRIILAVSLSKEDGNRRIAWYGCLAGGRFDYAGETIGDELAAAAGLKLQMDFGGGGSIDVDSEGLAATTADCC